MINDKYKLVEKSDADLHDWITEHKPGTNEYTAGVKESMSRVLAIEELMEKTEAPVRKREKIAMVVAVVSLAVAIIAIVLSN